MADNIIADEVKNALTANREEIAFEKIQGEDTSPLNQPVKEKDIGGNEKSDVNTTHIWKPETKGIKINEENHEDIPDFRSVTEQKIAQEKQAEPLDAPEQEINTTSEEEGFEQSPNEKSNEIPIAQANQAADALLGMTNNVLEVGGGYFVKIKKHEDFYEFEEIITLIDQQNDKNIQRIRLDKEDQLLLRPLIAQVLRKKSKKLTPEQQLMGAALSIIMKKAQVVMEVRSENALLESRILKIIREEKEEQAEDLPIDEVPEEPILDIKDDEIEDLDSNVLEVTETIKEDS